MDILSSRVAQRFLQAADPRSILAPNVRARVNSGLERVGMDGSRRFRSPGAALAEISQVLREFSLEISEVVTNSDVKTPDGRLSLEVSAATEDPSNPVLVRNSALAFHWTALETGFEVVAYLG